MQMQMTERDKKLIVFLAIFVIVVAGGYWGVYPLISKTISVGEQIQEEQILQQENEMKVAQLPMLNAENEEIEEEIAAARKDFYPEMTSDQVDKYMTELILDHNLYAYDLTISMPTEEASLDPYTYSQKAQEKDEEEEETSTSSQSQESGSTGGLDAATESGTDWDISEEIPTGIYAIGVSIRVGGERANLQKLIDEFSAENQKIHLQGYTWENQRSLQFSEDGSYEVGIEQTVTINLNLYMCEDETWN